MVKKFNHDLINRIMNENGLKKKDLARKLRISPQLLSYYISGPPTIHKLQRIAKALSTKESPVDWKELLL